MSSRGELMAAGIPPMPATMIGSSTATGLKATGSTKSGALVLSATMNVLATVSASTGAALPISSASPPVGVLNSGANNLSIYTGNSTDVIDALSAGAAYTLSAGKKAVFHPYTGGWICTKSA